MTEQEAILAAVRAAMDPERRAWQHDILISTIVEILARKGSLTQRELSDQLQLGWVGRATTPDLLAKALETARDQDLVVQVEGRRRRQWQVTEATRAESAIDRQWARSLLGDLQDEIESRLSAAFPDRQDVIGRGPNLTRALIDAMIRSTRGVFSAVQGSTSPNDLHEVRLNLRSVVPELRRTVQPTEVADVLAEAVVAAADPNNNFANDVLTTLVAGQILHGMVCRHDVPPAMPRASLVLDTSQLLALASAEPKVVALFEQFMQTAGDHHCRLILTSRVHDEWRSHWDSATEVEAALRARHGPKAAQLYKLQASLALANYGLVVEGGHNESFPSWAAARRNLEPIIARYRIEEVDVDAEGAVDPAYAQRFADEIESAMLAAGREPRSRRLRETDGYSAALVEAYRSVEPEALVPNSWFVASDRTAELAYQALHQNSFSLVADAASWLLLYSALTPTGEPGNVDLVDRLSEDIVLEAFLGIASSYTGDEMLELGDLLADGDELDTEDVNEALRISLLASPSQGVSSRAKDIARARVKRGSARVLKAKEVEGKAVREKDRQLDESRAEIRILKQGRTSDSQATAKAKRQRDAAILIGVVVVALVIGTVSNVFPWGWLVVAWIFGAYVTFEGVNYAQSEGGSKVRLLCGIGATIAFALVELVLDNGFHVGHLG